MGRQMRIYVPETTDHFILNWHFLADFKEKDGIYKNHDRSRAHRIRDIEPIPNDTSVWIRTENSQCPDIVVSTASAPRSYLVSTPSGQVRRNRSHLNHQQTNVSDAPSTSDYTSDTQRHSPIMTCSRTGVELKAPDRLTLQEEEMWYD